MSISILVAFFALLGSFLVVRSTAHTSFLKLFIGFIVFPPCVALVQQPLIAPEHCLMFVALLSCLLWDKDDFIASLSAFPLKIPLLILAMSFVSAGMQMNESTGYRLYIAARSFIDTVAVIVLTYHFGRFADMDTVKRIFLKFLIICGIFCTIEYLLKYNVVYKAICNSFPYYSGIFSLKDIASSSEGWRPRVFFTTVHANTFGAILDCVFWLYAPDALNRTGQERKNALIPCIIIMYLVLLTGSATALGCIVVTVGLFLFRRMRPTGKLLVIALALCIGTAVVVKVVSHFSAAREGSNISLRESQLLFTLVEIQEHPWLGYGYHYIGDVIFERDSSGDLIDSSLPAEIGMLESVLFSWWIERGLQFLIVFFGYMVMLGFYFERHRTSPPAVSGQYIIYAISLFLLLSGEMGGNTYMAFSLIGLCLGATDADILDADEEAAS